VLKGSVAAVLPFDSSKRMLSSGTSVIFSAAIVTVTPSTVQQDQQHSAFSWDGHFKRLLKAFLFGETAAH